MFTTLLCVCNGVRVLNTVIQSWVWFETLVLCWMAVSRNIALKCFLNTLHEHVPATHRVFQACRQMKGWRAERTAGKKFFFSPECPSEHSGFQHYRSRKTIAESASNQNIYSSQAAMLNTPLCSKRPERHRELQAALPQTHTRGAKGYLDPLLSNCAYYKQIHVYKNAVSNLQDETQGERDPGHALITKLFHHQFIQLLVSLWQITFDKED